MELEVGFIGLGAMGAPMVGRLLKHGYKVIVHDTDGAAERRLATEGALVGKSPVDVASKAKTVLVSLPTPAIVRQVALGDNGLIRGTAIRAYVDMSTTGPTVARDVANTLATKGIAALDAPVSGGVAGAEAGALSVIASGDCKTFNELRSILEIIGKNVFFVGDACGLAQTMKLINNLLAATSMVASCEAFAMGVKAGLDPEIMVSVLCASSGRNMAVEDKFPRAILPRTFDIGFKASLMAKDVKLCLEEAEALGVPMWVANTVRQMCSFYSAQSGPSTDFTEIIKCIESWAGVMVKGQSIKMC